MSTTSSPVTRVTSASALATLFQQFESQLLPKEAWTHEAHVLVALWYVVHSPDPLSRMRAGIQLLNAEHGVPTTLERGYHETITRIYVRLVQSFVAEQRRRFGADIPIWALAEAAVAQITRDLPLSYYSRDRLFCAEARFGWLEPDLKPLP